MKKLIKNIKPYVDLYRDDRTGIAWVEDGSTGNGHSAHPNIDASGSVKGMVGLGHWKKSDRAIKSHGFIHNVDKVVISDEYDRIAAENCLCIACCEKRNERDKK